MVRRAQFGSSPNNPIQDGFFIDGTFVPLDSESPRTDLSVSAPIAVRGTGDGGIVLRGPLDNPADKASIEWYHTDVSQLLAQIVAHEDDAHWSLYTSDQPMGTTDNGAQKRLDVDAGSSQVPVNWRNVSRWRLNAPDSGPLQADIVKPDSGSCELSFLDSSLNELWKFNIVSNERFQFIGRTGDVLFDSFSRYLDFQNATTLRGLRETGPQPTASDLDTGEWAFTQDVDGAGNAAWLYKDQSGTAHYFSPDGTL